MRVSIVVVRVGITERGVGGGFEGSGRVFFADGGVALVFGFGALGDGDPDGECFSAAKDIH